MAEKSPLPFEETLERLSEIVETLEDQQRPLSLEASVNLYEEGVELAKQANATLDAASARVEVLLEEGGSEEF